MAEPIFTNTITGERIPITGSVMPDGTISTAQIADGAITEAKLTASSISNVKIQASAVSTANVIDAAITNAKLANMSAGTVKGRLITTNTGTPQDLSPDQQIVNFTQTGAGGSSTSGNRWGVITYIAADGVMEVGKYLDFHDSDTETSDYAVRVQSTGTTGLVMNGDAVFGRFLLTANSISGQARLMVTFGGTFNNYYLKARMTPIPDNDVPIMRFIQGGASVANTSSYGWGTQFGTVVSGTMAENVIRLGGNTGSVSPTEFLEVEMKFGRMGEGTLCKTATWVGLNINGTPALGSLCGGALLNSNTATVEAAVLFYGLGSIKTAVYWLYGDMGGV